MLNAFGDVGVTLLRAAKQRREALADNVVNIDKVPATTPLTMANVDADHAAGERYIPAHHR